MLFNSKDRCQFCDTFIAIKNGEKYSRFKRRYRVRLVIESFEGDQQISRFENKAFKFFYCPLCGKRVNDGK